MDPVPESPAARRILITVKDELFPILNKLRDLLVRVQKCRIGYQLYSPELRALDVEYSIVSGEFFVLHKKMSTPDLLFEGLSETTDASSHPAPQLVFEYNRFQFAFSKLLDEGVSYTEIIDRTLDRKTQSLNNNRTFSLAVIAIFVSFAGNWLFVSETSPEIRELIQQMQVQNANIESILQEMRTQRLLEQKG